MKAELSWFVEKKEVKSTLLKLFAFFGIPSRHPAYKWQIPLLKFCLKLKKYSCHFLSVYSGWQSKNKLILLNWLLLSVLPVKGKQDLQLKLLNFPYPYVTDVWLPYSQDCWKLNFYLRKPNLNLTELNVPSLELLKSTWHTWFMM